MAKATWAERPLCPVCGQVDTAGDFDQAPFNRPLDLHCQRCGVLYRVIRREMFEPVEKQTVIDTVEQRQKGNTPQPQAVFSGPDTHGRGHLTGGLDPQRYRILRHAGKGAYRVLEGFHYVLDPVDDPLAFDLLLDYARRIEPANPTLARDLKSKLAQIDKELSQAQGLAAARDRAASHE